MINDNPKKKEQVNICLNEPVEHKILSTGFEKYRFVYQALPDIDMKKIDISVEVFGKKLASPIIISPMTGGTRLSAKINKNIAKAANQYHIGMGVGSQRVALENPNLAYSFKVRDVAPNILLFANLGTVDLNNHFGIKECQKAIEMIGADALFLYLNPLQKMLQVEGNTNFTNLDSRIREVCKSISVPVIIKEVGHGISKEVAIKIKDTKIAGIDVAGAGGTSWIAVEKYRNKTEFNQKLAETFGEIGIPTVESLLTVKEVASDRVIIASGGIRSGLDIAKAIALGANLVGIALPFLKPATESCEAVCELLKLYIQELKMVMFAIGTKNIKELKNTVYLKRNEY